MAQVQGEEIYLSHSGQEVDDNIDEVQAARGSEASLSERLADIVGDFEADQQRQETEIGAVAALGAKNLLQITAESQTKNGVEMTVDADGTLTFTRTATASSDSYFTIAAFTGDAGRFYTLTGCPQGGTDSTFYQYIGGTFRDYGSGVTRDGGTLRNVVVFISKNYSPDNLVFKPMLRPAEITDDTFVPHAPTNRELYEMILALQSGRSLQSAPALLMQAGRLDSELMDAGNDEEEEER